MTISPMARSSRSRSHEIDLAIEVFDTLREPGRAYTCREIAEAVGVSWQLIWQIERDALAKLQRAARRQEQFAGSLPTAPSR